ncbi:MAG: addiction module protein [Pseudolysinimonas sp.]
MAPEVAEVLETVKAMTHAQRADLAYRVLLTLDEESAEDPAVVEAAWRDEVGRRVDDYLGGDKNVTSVEQSHAKIRAELAANPE